MNYDGSRLQVHISRIRMIVDGERDIIIAVGIDVSKYKSTVTAKRPGSEVALISFEVAHDAGGIRALVDKLRVLDSDIRVVM